MKILVTGDKGFVGAATVKILEGRGHKIVGYDLMDGFDIRDSRQFDKVLTEARPARILHLAAIARFADADAHPLLAHETNVLGTANVAGAAERHHIPVVYASTGSVYMPIRRKPPITESFEASGNSVYGCTKLLGELYLQARSAPHIILRYSHLLGAEKRFHGLVGGFLSRIERGMAPQLYGGAQSNDFCYINDIAAANVAALEAPWDVWNSVFNIGTGEELSAKEAGDMVCEIFGYEGDVEVREARSVDPSRFVFDVSKAKEKLGFAAKFSFREALLDMAAQMGYEIANGKAVKRRGKKAGVEQAVQEKEQVKNPRLLEKVA